MSDRALKTVLVILPLEPHPEGVGSQKRAAAHLSALLGKTRVHLVVLDSDTTSAKSGDAGLYARCESTSVVKYVRRPRRPIARVFPFSILAELLDSTIARRLPSSEQTRNAFAKVAGQQIDTTLCFKVLGATLLDYAQAIVPLKSGRKIVDFDDIESLPDPQGTSYARRGFEQSIIDWLVSMGQRRAEDHCLATYDAVWVCSETDRQVLMSRKPKADIHAIPNSVPLVDVTPHAGGADVNLLFVGKMSYAPNHNGILWFCNKVLPLIKKSITHKVRLTIVGFEPRPEVQALGAMDDILVTGGVDSVAPYYGDCDIVIAPIRAGGGTRIKILEAMSHQRPVVSTIKGAEGIEISSGENIMIGDTPEAFAASCLELIQNPEKRRNIALRGRRLIEEKYSDNIVAATINKVI